MAVSPRDKAIAAIQNVQQNNYPSLDLSNFGLTDEDIAGLVIPNEVTVLRINDNKLTELPALPAELERLYCNNNQLIRLPALPARLQILECNDNQLTELPPLNNRLFNLYVMNNQLTTLPKIPLALKQIKASGNPLLEPYKKALEQAGDWGSAPKYRDAIPELLKQYTQQKGRELSNVKNVVAKGKNLPPNVENEIGTLLSGIPGTIEQQTAELKRSLTRTGGRKTRRNKKNRKVKLTRKRR